MSDRIMSSRTFNWSLIRPMKQCRTHFCWLTSVFILLFLFKLSVIHESPESDVQKDSRPLIVMGILSRDEYRERRDTLRNTWIKTMRKMQNSLPFRIKYAFFLDKNTAASLEEKKLHQDIVYLNVSDHGYAVKFGGKLYNLLKYMYQTFPDADFGMRVDDDVFLCVPQIFERINKLKSSNLYYGWRHGAQDTFKIKDYRIDEMLLVLGKNIIQRIAHQTYCGSAKCNRNTLQDTNYGGTSLRNWIAEYGDIDFHGDNAKITHTRIPPNSKDWRKFTNPDYCESNVAFHTVKMSAFMKVMHDDNEKLKLFKASKIGAVSGQTFSGNKERIARIFFFSNNNLTLAKPIPKYPCSYWAVLTTIFEPSNAVHYVTNQKDWCLVIVADLKTPPMEQYLSMLDPLVKPRIKYLSVAEQIGQYPVLAESIPFNSFARKNIGYMFAIHKKAKLIWDFDDDNLGIINNQNFESLNNFLSTCDGKTRNVKINPYPYFRKGNSRTWPRGFPLESIKTQYSTPSTCVKTMTIQPSIIQSLANGQPDVDAIYRLTYDIPFNFTTKPNIDKLFVLPRYSYAPFNAQATLWLPGAFKFMALPISVHGRVSDIWRSYIAEYFLHKHNMKVAFSPPYVFHNRTDHSLLGDFHAERPLYEQSGKLVDLLSSNDFSDIVSLYDDLYKRLYLEKEDLNFIRVWIKTFQFVT